MTGQYFEELMLELVIEKVRTQIMTSEVDPRTERVKITGRLS